MADQTASVSGNHNIVVQAHGDNIHVQVGVPHLTLIPVSVRLRAKPRRDLDILNPQYQAVPVVGREDDIQFLNDWLAASPPISITAIIGSGGSGKTRLAYEFLQHLPPNWQGGFLEAKEAEEFLKQINLSEWSWQKPTLIVVDYAALLASTLGRWFAELSDHATPSHPLRILLLERHADLKSGWYHDLADSTWHGQQTQELFSPAEPRRVAPLGTEAQRRQVLQAGLEAAAALAQPPKTIPPLPEPGKDPWFDQRLAANQWADPLLLLMAAVIAVSDGLNVALSLSRLDLATQLAIRERDRIRKSIETTVAKDLLTHLYGCITLCGGLDRDQAAEVAEQEFAALHKQYPGGPGQAVEDLALNLGAGLWLPPLLPDLLGEALLPVTLGSNGAAATGRLAKITPSGVASSLVRCAQDFGHAGERWPVDWLRMLVSGGKTDDSLLMEIEAVLPLHTLVLRKLALEVTIMLVFRLEEGLQKSERVSAHDLFRLAELYTRVSVRLTDMGQPKDAVAASDRAVYYFRALAKDDPQTYIHALAGALLNQSKVQSDFEMRAEALASISEAAAYFHMLAEYDAGYMPQLALALNNLANRQGAMGQRAEALISIAKAVEIRRELARIDPDTYLSDLAMSLSNLARRQNDMQQEDEALESFSDSAQYYRTLAKARPDAFLPFLAKVLTNLCGMQSSMGLLEEALDTGNEALLLAWELTETDRQAFLPVVIRALVNQAAVLRELKRYDEAVAAANEAVEHCRSLAEVDPSAVPTLAMTLLAQSGALQDADQLVSALASAVAAVDHLRALAEATPDAFLNDLADALGVLGHVQRKLEQLPAARDSLTEAVRIRRLLIQEQQEAFLPALVDSIAALGACLETMEQMQEARDSAAEALTLLAPLFSEDPERFTEMAQGLMGSYLDRSANLKLEPDPELLNMYSKLPPSGEANA